MTAFIEAAITTTAAYSLGAMDMAVSAIGLKARLELSKASTDRSPGTRALRGSWRR